MMNQPRRLQDYIEEFKLQDHLNSDLLRCLRITHMAANREIDMLDSEDAPLYFLVDGGVHVLYDHLNGKRSIIGTMEPLALIGDLDLFYEPNLRLNVVTTQPSVFLCMDQALALRYGQDDPRFLRLIIYHLSLKLTRTTGILKHNVLSLSGQVAAYILNQPYDNNGKIQIPSKSYVADLMGITGRHLNRVLNTLVSHGFIQVQQNTIHILDREGLASHAES